MSNESGGLKIHNIDLSPDQWENTPKVVYKAFRVNLTNMQQMKRWSDHVEARLKEIGASHQQLDSRLSASDRLVEGAQGALLDLGDRFETMSLLHDAQSGQAADCIDHIIQALAASWERLATTFGKEPLGSLGEEGGEGALSAAAVSPSARLERLEGMGRGLAGRVDHLIAPFEELATWRQGVDVHCDSLRGTVADLASGATATRQRLLAWREALQENSRAADALSATLAIMQGDVRLLQSTQVRHEDVNRTGADVTRELEALLARTDDRLRDVKDQVDFHASHMEDTVVELRTWAGERIEEHSTKVGHLLERSLNPVSAYLNSLHVKADGLRSDVDRLDRSVPALGNRVGEVVDRLQRSEDAQKEENEAFTQRLDGLGDVADAQRRDAEAKSADFSGAVGSLRAELNKRAGDLTASLRTTAAELHEALLSELPKVASDVDALEQKVASWIHANPLPVKLGEARLYALERRLAQETDARLELELHVKAHASEGGSSSSLPRLPSKEVSTLRSIKAMPTPRSGGGGGGGGRGATIHVGRVGKDSFA